MKKSESSYHLTLLVILVIFVLALLFYWIMNQKNPQPQQINQIVQRERSSPFYDVYYPPLRDNPYLRFGNDFSQVGILKGASDGDKTFLPIFGRPIDTRRDLWTYYAVSNTGAIPGIKLTVRNSKGKNLLDDTGAPQLYNDDTVVVDGYDTEMKVSLYDQKSYSYSI